jgi:hypothetical protein
LLFVAHFTPDEPQYMQDVVQDMRDELTLESTQDLTNVPAYDSPGVWDDEEESDDVIRVIRQEIRELGPQKMSVPMLGVFVLLN